MELERGLLRFKLFLSTPSVRRATSSPSTISGWSTFLSTPSARRATTLQSDGDRLSAISIHALREEGDKTAFHKVFPIKVFLSTSSVRRATVTDDYISSAAHISIHALREEGDGVVYE